VLLELVDTERPVEWAKDASKFDVSIVDSSMVGLSMIETRRLVPLVDAPCTSHSSATRQATPSPATGTLMRFAQSGDVS
jgi:hypothetical protein